MKLKFILTIFSFFVLSIGNAQAYDMELAEASKCSRYFSIYESAFHMPSNLLRAVATTESGKYIKTASRPLAWPWTINVQGKGYQFRNKRETIRAVKQFQREGAKSIDVGCMQINLMYHPEAFRNLEQALEPRYNIVYAAQFLREKYEKAGNWKTAIGLYHNADPAFNKDYIKRVYAAWRMEDKSFQMASLDKPYISVTNTPKAAEADISDITKNVLATFDR